MRRIWSSGSGGGHSQSHVLDGGDHTVSGQTDGAYLRATGAASFAFETLTTVLPVIVAPPMVFTNLGAGPVDLSASIRLVCDLSKVTQVRVATMQSVSGGGTGDLKLEYSTDDSTWADLTTLIDLSTAAAAKASTWQNIPVGAQADMIVVRVVGINGNGTEDHTLKGIYLHTR